MTARKKIIYIVTKGNFGGAQKYVYDLSTSLPKDEYDVLVLTGEGNKLPEKLQEAQIRTSEISSMQRDISFIKEISSFLNLVKIIFRENPDIIHSNSPKAGGLGSLAGRIYKIFKNNKLKIIYTAHGWPFNEDVSPLKKTARKFFSWLTIILSTKTVTISKENYNQALQMPFSKNKLSFIYNGIKSPEFYNKEESRKILSEKTGAKTEGVWIGTISELHKNKGLKYIIEAISEIENVCLFIIGEGEERERLQKIINQKKLNDRVFLVGYLDNAVKYLKAFDLFTLTSLKEGHPYTLLEAGFANLPIIGSNISGIEDILKNHRELLSKPKDPNDIKIKLNNLLENKEKVAQLGLDLGKEIRDRFSFEKTFEKTIELY